MRSLRFFVAPPMLTLGGTGVSPVSGVSTGQRPVPRGQGKGGAPQNDTRGKAALVERRGPRAPAATPPRTAPRTRAKARPAPLEHPLPHMVPQHRARLGPLLGRQDSVQGQAVLDVLPPP